MARHIGAVRFDDGHLLFPTADAASLHRADPPPNMSKVSSPGEPVKVMPYFEQGNPEVSFHSTADRMLMVFTGPRSFDEQVATPKGGWFGHG